MSSTVSFRGTEHRDAILGTVRYGHVWDWSTRWVEDDAFDFPSKLGLFDNYEFSNRLCRSDEECARERDYVIVWNERSSRRTLQSYFAYYRRSRTHLALGKDAREPRAVEPPEQGRVLAIPQVGGLHHRYLRQAA